MRLCKNCGKRKTKEEVCNRCVFKSPHKEVGFTGIMGGKYLYNTYKKPELSKEKE